MKGTKYCGCSALDKDCGQAEGRGELVCSQNKTESAGTTSCRSVVDKNNIILGLGSG